MESFEQTARPRPIICILVAIVLLFLTLGPTGADEPIDQCSLPPELVTPVLEIDPTTSDCPVQHTCARDLAIQALELAELHPDLVPVQRSYQDLIRAMGGEAFDELKVRYRLRLEQRPDDAASHYLVARIDPEDPQMVRAAHLRAVELDPGFPWGHLGLAVSYWQYAGRSLENDIEPDPAAMEEDHQGAERHMNEFMRLCPARFQEPLRNSVFHFSPDYWRPHVPRLRSALEQAPARLQLAVVRDLWALEFKTASYAEHDDIRESIATDLERIAAMNLVASNAWWGTLEEGYQLTGDSTALENLLETRAEADPCSQSVARNRTQELEFDKDSQQATLAALEEVSGWVRRCPENFFYCSAEFHISTSMDLPAEDRLGLLDRYLQCWEANRESIRSSQSPYYQVAQELLNRDLDIERVPALIQQEIDLASTGDGGVPDNVPEEFRAMMTMTRYMGRISNFALLAESRLRLGDPVAAADAIQEADDALGELELRELDLQPQFQQTVTVQHGRIEEFRGRMAEATGHPLDAIGHYLAASGFETAEGGSKEEASRLWVELGGSPETFELIHASSSSDTPGIVVEPSSWAEKNEPLADFSLEDLTGRTWTQEDLAEKTTVINLWATWCGPCKLELPFLQKVHEAVADRSDVLVLTLNADHKLGLIAPFLERHGYTFPACVATDYIMNTTGGISIPQTWIVSGEGIVRFTQRGFDPTNGEEWVGEVLAKIDLISVD